MNTENYKTDEQVWYEICEGIIDAATPEDITFSNDNPYYQYVDFYIRSSDNKMAMNISMFLRDGKHAVHLYGPDEYGDPTVSYFETGATELFIRAYEKYFSVVR